MKVGLNILFVAPGLTGGIETYARGLVRALDAAPSITELVVFAGRAAASELQPFTTRARFVVADAALERRIVKNAYEQFVFPFRVSAERLDVLHSLAYVGPVFCRTPQVLTIPDLNFKFAQHALHGFKRVFLERVCRCSAARAKGVIAISNFTKDELARHWPSVAAKTRAIHIGAEPVPSGSLPELARDRFVVFVGGGRHKNSATAIRAFGGMTAGLDWRLTLIGRVTEDIREEIDRLPPSRRALIDELGFIPKKQLDEVWRTVGSIVIPSRYEGFGLPVIEAQSRAAAVICARAASLPEVAGDGALFFDPDNTAELARAMALVASDRAVRADLQSRGLANVKRFEWREIASQTIDVYKDVLRDIGRSRAS